MWSAVLLVSLLLGCSWCQVSPTKKCSDFEKPACDLEKASCVWDTTTGSCTLTSAAQQCETTIATCLKGKSVTLDGSCTYLAAKFVCARETKCYDANQHNQCASNQLFCGSVTLNCPVGCGVAIASTQCSALDTCTWDSSASRCLSSEGTACSKLTVPSNCNANKNCVYKNNFCMLKTDCIQYEKESDCTGDATCTWTPTSSVKCAAKKGCIEAKNPTECTAISPVDCKWDGGCVVNVGAVACEKEVDICVEDTGSSGECAKTTARVTCARKLGCYTASLQRACQANKLICITTECPEGCNVAVTQPQCEALPGCSYNLAKDMCENANQCVGLKPTACDANQACRFWDNSCLLRGGCFGKNQSQALCTNDADCRWRAAQPPQGGYIGDCGPKPQSVGCAIHGDVTVCEADTRCKYDRTLNICIPKGKKSQDIVNSETLADFLTKLVGSTLKNIDAAEFDENGVVGFMNINDQAINVTSPIAAGRSAIANMFNGIRRLKTPILVTDTIQSPAADPYEFIVDFKANIGGRDTGGHLFAVTFSKTSNLIVSIYWFSNSAAISMILQDLVKAKVPLGKQCQVNNRLLLPAVMITPTISIGTTGSTPGNKPGKWSVGFCTAASVLCPNGARDTVYNPYATFVATSGGECDNSQNLDTQAIDDWDGSGAPSSVTGGGVKLTVTSSTVSTAKLTYYVACDAAMAPTDGIKPFTTGAFMTNGVAYFRSKCACQNGCDWQIPGGGGTYNSPKWAADAAAIASSFMFAINGGTFSSFKTILNPGIPISFPAGAPPMKDLVNVPTDYSNDGQKVLSDWRYYWFSQGDFATSPYFFASPTTNWIWMIGMAKMTLLGGDVDNKADWWNNFIAVGLKLDKSTPMKVTEMKFFLDSNQLNVTRTQLGNTVCKSCIISSAFALMKTDACQAKAGQKQCLTRINQQLGNCGDEVSQIDQQVSYICNK